MDYDTILQRFHAAAEHGNRLAKLILDEVARNQPRNEETLATLIGNMASLMSTVDLARGERKGKK